MTQPPVQFVVRCVCGEKLKAYWEEKAHKFEWDEVKKEDCLVVEVCKYCSGKKRNSRSSYLDYYDY